MRKLLIPIILALAASTAMPSYAASIGRASTVSVSRPATPSVARAAPAPSRIGGGQSVGMTRPNVVQAARAPTPTTPIPTTVAPAQRQYTPAPSYAPATPVAAPAGPSAGSMFAATAGGALVGTMVGNAISQPHTTVVAGGGGAPVMAAAPGAAVGSPGYAAQAPAVVASSGSGWAGFWSFLQLCLIIAALAALILFAVALWRNRKPTASSTNTTASMNLPFSPAERFLAIQTMFIRGHRSALVMALGQDLHQLLDSLPTFDLSRDCTVGAVSYEVLDRSDDIISIRFRATDYGDGTDSDPVAIHEVWHFIRSGEGWLLNGIEQV